MKNRRLFSIVTAVIMIFSLCTFLPVKVPVPIEASAATDVSNLNPVDSTYSLIKSLEGCDLNCFWDVAQWTIGYGNKCPYTHTSNGTYWHQKGGHSISESEARSLFSSKLSGYVNTLKSNCKGLSMNQNQFDALLSATYNHGNVNNCPLKYYLQGKLTESQAREQYYVWCINAGTKDEKGLRNRRKKEADVFFSGSDFCTCDSSYAGNYVVTTSGSNLNIRDGESTSGAILGKIPNGTTVYVSKGNGSWLYVENYNGISGHVSATYMKKVEELVSKPTYSNLTADKTMISVGEEITFTASSDYATGFTIGIDNETSRYITQEMPNGQLTLTFNEAGSYGAYVTSYNSAGYVDSSWINFTVGKWYDILQPENFGDSFDAVIVAKEPWITIRANSDQNVILQAEEGITSEMWRFTRQTDGSYTICNFNNEKLLDAYGAGIINGTNVVIDENNGGQNQKWFIYSQDGGYLMRPAYTDMVLDVAGGNYISGTNIQLYEKNDTSAQIFSLYHENLTYGTPKKGNLTIQSKQNEIILNIETSPYTDYFRIYRSIDNKNFKVIAEITDNTYIDDNLEYDKKYYYKIDYVNRYYTIKSDILSIQTDKNIIGDINADDEFNISDAVLLQKWLLGTSNATLENWKAADMNDDGVVDIFDMVLMKQALISK